MISKVCAMRTNRFLSLTIMLACMMSPGGVMAQSQPQRLAVTPLKDVGWQAPEQTQRAVLQAPSANAPNIDGLLSDRCWVSAPKIDTFTRLTGLPPKASRWVTIQATHDANRLYLAARLDKPSQTLRAEITKNGGRIWMDDALEIFLHDPRSGTNYQIDVNALGTWFAGSAESWTPDLKVAARIHDDHWTLELSLPWSDLGFAQADEKVLKAQFRYLVNGQSGAVSWVDAEQGQTSAYGDLALTAGAAGEADSASLRVLRYLQHAALPVGTTPEAAGVELFNPTNTPQTADVRLYRVNYVLSPRLTLSNQSTMDSKETVTLRPGERKTVLVGGAMTADSPQRIRQTLNVRLVDPKTQQVSQRIIQRTRDIGLMEDFTLQLQRERFFAGDRGVEGELAIGIAEEAYAASSLHIEFGTRRQILGEATFDRLPARRIKLGLDLSGLEPGAYQLIATLRTPGGVQEKLLPIAIEQAWLLPASHRIPIHLDLPEGLADAGNIPLYVGVSFPAGTLQNLEHLRVVNAHGAELPSQVEALAHWGPGGSIRWAGVHFTTPSLSNRDEKYFVEIGRDVSRMSTSGPVVQVQRTDDAIRIDTGAARFDVPRTGPLLGDAWAGGRQVLMGGKACLILVDQDGKVATEMGGTAEEAPQIETQGTQLVVIRREGWLRRQDGSELGRYVVRLFFRAGQSHVRVQHSFINTQDTMAVQYRDVALRVTPAFAGPWRVKLDDSPKADGSVYDTTIDPARGEATYMAQTVYRHHGQDEQRYVIGLKRDGQWREDKRGSVSGQWASVANASAGVGVAVTLRNFVETFPSELEVGPEGLTTHLWSSRGGRLLDYRPSALVDYFGKEWFDFNASKRAGSPWKSGSKGMAELIVSAAGTSRTHDMTIHLFADAAQEVAVAKVAQLTQEPALAIQDPAWLRTTGAMGPLAPRDAQKFPRAERFIESFFRYHLVGQAEHWGNYGFLDHGSGPHAFRSGPHDYAEQPNPQLKRTFHFDYKFRSTPWRMYARSGDRMYFEYGDAKNRSLADFRWMHHSARGMRRGAMIVSETSFTLPLYWAGSETLAFQGQDIDNFIYQYYLTGDRWVNETVREFGQYMIDTFDPLTTRPAGDLYSYQPYMFLASLYEMTWDERLGDKLRAMRWTLDPETTTGFMNWPTMSAWYKWYVEMYGPLRDYQVTGSHEAKETFLKLAQLMIDHGPAGRHAGGETMGYDDNYGLAMNLAWQLTGDVRYPSHARDNFNTRLFWFSQSSGETHRVGPFVAAHSPQGLDSLAFLMDLLDRMPADVPMHPALPLEESDAPVDIYFLKPPEQEARIEMVTGSGFDLGLTQLLDKRDAKKRLGSITLTTYPTYTARDPQAGLDRDGQFARLLVPKEALPGQYRLQDVDHVDWSTIKQMVVVAPKGAALDIASAEPASWYFLLPAQKRGSIHVDQPMILTQAGSSRIIAADSWYELEGGSEDVLVQIQPQKAGFEPLPFQKSRSHVTMSQLVPSSVFVQFRGDIPPVLAAHDPSHFFLPTIIPSTQERSSARKRSTPEMDE